MMALNVPVIGVWPDGKEFVVVDCYENGKPQRVCWTPTVREWAQVRQILAGLAELAVLAK